jgi:hypothetical protein
MLDITTGSGMDFVHRIAEPDGFFMPDSMGSGAAFLDYNNDDRLDILSIQNAGPASTQTHKLYRQEPDGRFADVTAGSGLDIGGYGMGVAVGDVNNDGYVDVLISEYLSVKLLLNQGGTGKFVDVTQAAGLSNSYWASSVAFVDYDRDNLLDLVVTNYVLYVPSVTCHDANGAPDYCGPGTFQPIVSRLFHNLGPGDGQPVRFQDVTEPSGIGSIASAALGVIGADFTGDGWQDIFITNDQRPNHLWVNQTNGTFRDEALDRGIAYNGAAQMQANMGIAAGDADGDGFLDIYVTHLTQEGNVLWSSDAHGMFRDKTSTVGLAAPKWRGTGFGVVMDDFDNDGWPDVAAVNGRIGRAVLAEHEPQTLARLGKWTPYAERNQLFANLGQGQFADISPEQPAFCAEPNVARGLAAGDIDNDGRTDLLVTCIDAPARLYRNVAMPKGHWLTVRAIDPAAGGRDAYGAKIVVGGGGKTKRGLIAPSQSIYCSIDPRAHIGLGDMGVVDYIEVTWPDGSVERFEPAGIDRFQVVRKGEGKAGPIGRASDGS